MSKHRNKIKVLDTSNIVIGGEYPSNEFGSLIESFIYMCNEISISCDSKRYFLSYKREKDTINISIETTLCPGMKDGRDS